MTDILDPNDMNQISAKNTDLIEEAPDPDAVANPDGSNGSSLSDDGNASDRTLRTYQDDFDSGDDDTDPIIDEQTDDPTEELQVPVDEFKSELDKLDIGDHNEHGSEDMRETLEDREEDDDGAASTA